MVPTGARQIDGIAGSAGTVSRAQAAAGTAYRCGIKHPGNTARFWPEGWCALQKGVYPLTRRSEVRFQGQTGKAFARSEPFRMRTLEFGRTGHHEAVPPGVT